MLTFIVIFVIVVIYVNFMIVFRGVNEAANNAITLDDFDRIQEMLLSPQFFL